MAVCPAQVMQDRVADLLRQGKPLLASALAAHGDPPVAPVDIGERELGDLARAQPEPGQKQKHRPVPQPIAFRRAGADHPLDILRGQGTGERMKAARKRSQGWRAAFRRALPRGPEKAQEGADRDDNGLGTPDPMGMRPLQRRSCAPSRRCRRRGRRQGPREAPRESPDRRPGLSLSALGVGASRNGTPRAPASVGWETEEPRPAGSPPVREGTG